MLDEYLFGAVSRISPEAPVPIVDIRQRKYVAGGAANVAANVQGLCAEAMLTGLRGSDAPGDRLHSLIEDAGIATRWIEASASRPTTSKTRVIAGQQQIVRYDSEDKSDLSANERAALELHCNHLLTQVQTCIVSDYGKGTIAAGFCEWLIDAASRRRCPVIVDPKGRDYRKYRGCTLITPNLREAAQASSVEIENDGDLTRAGERLLELLPGSCILVTRGADGMTLFRPEADQLTIPTVAQEVFDVVGAGDTVVAALGISLSVGLPLETAMRVANVAAGIAVGRHGTVAVTWNELAAHPELRLWS